MPERPTIIYVSMLSLNFERLKCVWLCDRCITTMIVVSCMVHFVSCTTCVYATVCKHAPLVLYSCNRRSTSHFVVDCWHTLSTRISTSPWQTICRHVRVCTYTYSTLFHIAPYTSCDCVVVLVQRASVTALRHERQANVSHYVDVIMYNAELYLCCRCEYVGRNVSW